MRRKKGEGEKKTILALFGFILAMFFNRKTGGVDKDFWTIQNSK